MIGKWKLERLNVGGKVVEIYDENISDVFEEIFEEKKTALIPPSFNCSWLLRVNSLFVASFLVFSLVQQLFQLRPRWYENKTFLLFISSLALTDENEKKWKIDVKSHTFYIQKKKEIIITQNWKGKGWMENFLWCEPKWKFTCRVGVKKEKEKFLVAQLSNKNKK